MPKDYIPENDNDFVDWLNNFLPKANADKAKLNVADADLADLTNLRDTLATALADEAARKSAFEASKQTRRGARKDTERKARSLAQHIQRQESVTDALRASLRLTVPDAEPSPAPAPVSFPILTIDTSKRLQHGLKMRDNATPDSRALPAGVDRIEIHRYVGTTAPTDTSQFLMIDTATRNTYTAKYQSADAGKTAYFNLRYVGTNGDKGPWSETISATITG
jgi:hypothetical protein